MQLRSRRGRVASSDSPDAPAQAEAADAEGQQHGAPETWNLRFLTHSAALYRRLPGETAGAGGEWRALTVYDALNPRVRPMSHGMGFCMVALVLAFAYFTRDLVLYARHEHWAVQIFGWAISGYVLWHALDSRTRMGRGELVKADRRAEVRGQGGGRRERYYRLPTVRDLWVGDAAHSGDKKARAQKLLAVVQPFEFAARRRQQQALEQYYLRFWTAAGLLVLALLLFALAVFVAYQAALSATWSAEGLWRWLKRSLDVVQVEWEDAERSIPRSDWRELGACLCDDGAGAGSQQRCAAELPLLCKDSDLWNAKFAAFSTRLGEEYTRRVTGSMWWLGKSTRPLFNCALAWFVLSFLNGQLAEPRVQRYVRVRAVQVCTEMLCTIFLCFGIFCFFSLAVLLLENVTTCKELDGKASEFRRRWEAENKSARTKNVFRCPREFALGNTVVEYFLTKLLPSWDTTTFLGMFTTLLAVSGQKKRVGRFVESSVLGACTLTTKGSRNQRFLARLLERFSKFVFRVRWLGPVVRPVFAFCLGVESAEIKPLQRLREGEQFDSTITVQLNSWAPTDAGINADEDGVLSFRTLATLNMQQLMAGLNDHGSGLIRELTFAATMTTDRHGFIFLDDEKNQKIRIMTLLLNSLSERFRLGFLMRDQDPDSVTERTFCMGLTNEVGERVSQQKIRLFVTAAETLDALAGVDFDKLSDAMEDNWRRQSEAEKDDTLLQHELWDEATQAQTVPGLHTLSRGALGGLKPAFESRNWKRWQTLVEMARLKKEGNSLIWDITLCVPKNTNLPGFANNDDDGA